MIYQNMYSQQVKVIMEMFLCRLQKYFADNEVKIYNLKSSKTHHHQTNLAVLVATMYVFLHN